MAALVHGYNITGHMRPKLSNSNPVELPPNSTENWACQLFDFDLPCAQKLTLDSADRLQAVIKEVVEVFHNIPLTLRPEFYSVNLEFDVSSEGISKLRAGLPRLPHTHTKVHLGLTDVTTKTVGKAAKGSLCQGKNAAIAIVGWSADDKELLTRIAHEIGHVIGQACFSVFEHFSKT